MPLGRASFEKAFEIFFEFIRNFPFFRNDHGERVIYTYIYLLLTFSKIRALPRALRNPFYYARMEITRIYTASSIRRESSISGLAFFLLSPVPAILFFLLFFGEIKNSAYQAEQKFHKHPRCSPLFFLYTYNILCAGSRKKRRKRTTILKIIRP